MAALSVEHLKVMAALTVEPATASSSIYLFAPQISQKMVEHLKVLISRAPKGPYGRARNRASRAPAGPYGRAPKGPLGRAPKGPIWPLFTHPPQSPAEVLDILPTR